MSTVSAKTRVTLFSSISSIATTLQKAAPIGLHLDCVQDPDALSGYGGTVIFEADKLSEHSRRVFRDTEILITEPAVLAAILQKEPNLSQLETFPRLKYVAES